MSLKVEAVFAKITEQWTVDWKLSLLFALNKHRQYKWFKYRLYGTKINVLVYLYQSFRLKKKSYNAHFNCQSTLCEQTKTIQVKLSGFN